MKICWDNLEKLEYRHDRNQWQCLKYKSNFCIYKEYCKYCNEPFLNHKNKNSDYCSIQCSVKGKNNPMYGKKHTEKTKKLIGEKSKIREPGNWKGGYSSKNIPLYDTYSPQLSWIEKTKRNKQDKNILEVKCTYCGKWFVPKATNVNLRVGMLNGRYESENRLYCSNQCKEECPIFRKSKYPKGYKKITSREVQPELRQMVFERDEYTCQKCEKHQDELDCGLHCHHKEGILWEPLESADIDRAITLCKDCHIKVHKLPDCGFYDMRCK